MVSANLDEHLGEQRLDQQLCFALYAASRAVVRSYAPLLAPEGLTYPQYLTLLVLWENPDEPFSVGELGRRLHLDSGTLTPLLKRLQAMGIVDRRRDRGDERRVLVALTDEGLALRGRLAWVPRHLAQIVGGDQCDDAPRSHDSAGRTVPSTSSVVRVRSADRPTRGCRGHHEQY